VLKRVAALFGLAIAWMERYARGAEHLPPRSTGPTTARAALLLAE
jgi:hypothetical protein